MISPLTWIQNWLVCSFWIGVLFIWLSPAQCEDAVPNVIFILADDLGIRDLGCYGADLHETPAIDRLASDGIRFLNAYAPSPVCSPTRASILTGKHPARIPMTIWSEGAIDGPKNRKLVQGDSLHDLPLEEVTIAERLGASGYFTASVGKWHLGDAIHSPECQGFDVNIAGNHWGAPTTFFFPYRGARSNGEFRYLPGLGLGQEGEYLTDRLTDEAIAVVDHAVDRGRPFFLWLTHYAPHTPIDAKKEWIDYFEAKRQSGLQHQNAAYAAMVRSLDESVERLMSHLEKRGLSEKTLVVFTSDNGGYIGQDSKRNMPVTSNAPWRSGKASLYEGGIRVPMIVRWPGRVKSGVEVGESVVLTDWFATLESCCLGGSTTSDGVDLSPLFQHPAAALGRQEFFFHYPHYYHQPPTTPCSAVRQGPWKLIEYYEDGRRELYHLEDDPGEQVDLASEKPRQAEMLLARMNLWRERLGARLPRSANPETR